jgi:hypothetical protein
MNTNESSTIASRGTRWQQQVLEGIIGLVALLAIIAGVVAGLDAFTADLPIDAAATLSLLSLPAGFVLLAIA